MQSEQNKAILRQFFEAFAANDQQVLGRLLAADVRVHLPGEVAPTGREAFLEIVQQWSHAFSELGFVIEDSIADADSVASRVTLRAIHDRSAFLGVPPTGRRISVEILTIERIRGDRIVERWVSFDLLRLLDELDPKERV